MQKIPNEPSRFCIHLSTLFCRLPLNMDTGLFTIFVNSKNAKVLSFVLLCTVAVIYCAIQSQLPHNTFWSNDGGEKLVQVRSLIENGSSKPAFPYDSLGLETKGSFEFAPFYPGHARIIENQLMPTVPIYFPLLSSRFFLMWEHAGLYVIPILATQVTIFCLIILASDNFDPLVAPLTVIGVGLASPIFFYSLLFFEHTLATSLCTIGLTLLEVGRHKTKTRAFGYAAAAALSISIGVWFRGDVYFFILGILAGMLLLRAYRKMFLPFMCFISVGLAPFFFINHLLYGTAIGSQVDAMVKSTDGLGFSIVSFAARQWDIISYFLVSFIDTPYLNWVFLLAAICPAILLNLRNDKSPRRDTVIIIWCTLLCLITFFTLTRLFLLDNPMGSSLGILGIFACIPFLPFSLVHIADRQQKKKSDFVRFLFTVMMVSLIGYCLGLPSRGGLQWGPRYLLPLYPVMILLALHGAVNVRKSIFSAHLRRVFSILFALILFSGISIQLFGIKLLYDKKTATAINITAIQEMTPRVIITDTWWIPEDNGDIYFKYPIYTFYTFEKLGTLLTRLENRGEREVVLLSAADYRDFIAQQPGLILTSFAMTEHHRTTMFNLYLHKIQIEEFYSMSLHGTQ